MRFGSVAGPASHQLFESGVSNPESARAHGRLLTLYVTAEYSRWKTIPDRLLHCETKLDTSAVRSPGSVHVADTELCRCISVQSSMTLTIQNLDDEILSQIFCKLGCSYRLTSWQPCSKSSPDVNQQLHAVAAVCKRFRSLVFTSVIRKLIISDHFGLQLLRLNPLQAHLILRNVQEIVLLREIGNPQGRIIRRTDSSIEISIAKGEWTEINAEDLSRLSCLQIDSARLQMADFAPLLTRRFALVLNCDIHSYSDIYFLSYSSFNNPTWSCI
jgi:hypothetical protein